MAQGQSDRARLADNIERIGDHATNFAESVYYIVQGGAIPGERPKINVTDDMLAELRDDNQRFVAAMREAHDVCDEYSFCFL